MRDCVRCKPNVAGSKADVFVPMRLFRSRSRCNGLVNRAHQDFMMLARVFGSTGVYAYKPTAATRSKKRAQTVAWNVWAV
eukprot:SAG31_NODE_5406_length_2555_cov_1.521580_4_plen_80_part_00